MRRRSGFGWLQLFTGVLLIALGALVFWQPRLAAAWLVFACGAAAVALGAADIVLFIRVERYTGFGPMVCLVCGILSVMSGAMLLAYPGMGTVVLTLLFPLWFITHCIGRMLHLSHVRLVAGRGVFWVLLALNAAGLALGFVMLVHPLFAFSTLRCLAGACLVLLGADGVVVALSRMGRR